MYTNILKTEVDKSFWTSIQDLAVKRPNAVRTLSLPIAAAVFTREIFIPPCLIIESLCTRKYKLLAIQILYLPLSPFVGAVKATKVFFEILISPLHTAKIKVAEQEFKVFTKNFNKRDSWVGKLYIPSELDYAHAELAKFKAKIYSSNEIADTFFLPDAFAEVNLDILIKAKILQANQKVQHLDCTNQNSVGIWNTYLDELLKEP